MNLADFHFFWVVVERDLTNNCQTSKYVSWWRFRVATVLFISSLFRCGEKYESQHLGHEAWQSRTPWLLSCRCITALSGWNCRIIGSRSICSTPVFESFFAIYLTRLETFRSLREIGWTYRYAGPNFGNFLTRTRIWPKQSIMVKVWCMSYYYYKFFSHQFSLEWKKRDWVKNTPFTASYVKWGGALTPSNLPPFVFRYSGNKPSGQALTILNHVWRKIDLLSNRHVPRLFTQQLTQLIHYEDYIGRI